MNDIYKNSASSDLIPILVDVERNIDEHQMIRCSYFSVQSDEPLPDWNLRIGKFNSPILLLNIEAILLGAPNETRVFKDHSDITAMYDYIESQDELFVDINDIWIPVEWFGGIKTKQGMVFRISQDLFTHAWKFRNDKIVADELMESANVKTAMEQSKSTQSPMVIFSEEETYVFTDWTKSQIEESRSRYDERQRKSLEK